MKINNNNNNNNREQTVTHFDHINLSFHSQSFPKKYQHHDHPIIPPENIETVVGKKKIDRTQMFSDYVFDGPSKTYRYLFLLGHYEQLGKTTINFLHARHLASLMNRDLVVPFVRNSRFCGLPEGWTGPKRKKSREFLPMENYFNLASIEKMYLVPNMTRLTSLNEYYDECTNSGITMIYFIYNKIETLRYLHLTEAEYDDLILKLKVNNGWADCWFVEQKIKTSYRMKNIKLNNAICVDPETVVNLDSLEQLVHNSKCAAFFLWRGIGELRTHFNVSLPQNHPFYLSQIEFSDFVMQEANKFLQENFFNQPYISIQIRSERQLAWYSIKKFKQCLDLVVKVVNILIVKKEIKKVFISSDLEKHGSDQISVLLNSTTRGQAIQYFQETVKKLNGALYKPDKSRGLIFNDAGFVALTQMEILSRSRHLVTLGAGTYQSWLVALFKKQKKIMKRSWSLTRVCATELKRNSPKHVVVPFVAKTKS